MLRLNLELSDLHRVHMYNAQYYLDFTRNITQTAYQKAVITGYLVAATILN